jgi:acetyl-CoA acyltransferase
MKPLQPIYIVGGAQTPFLGRGHPDFVHKRHPDFGSRENPTLEAHLNGAVRAAFDACGVEPAHVDKAYVANFLGELFVSQGHLGAMLAGAAPALDGKPVARIEAACASGGCAIGAAVDALHASADVALVAGVEVETTVSGKLGVDFVARAAHYDSERPLSQFTFPHLFARRAAAYKSAWGWTDEDVARVVEKNYRHARRNPNAQMHAVDLTLDDVARASKKNYEFLEDPALRPHMRLLECTHFGDGAAAVLLATADGLARLGIAPADCTELISMGHSVAPLAAERDPLHMSNMARAAAEAYADAALAPEHIDFAEVHDCFAITELEVVEALGFAEPGQAAAALKAGRFDFGGGLPVNPSGGLLGGGHPIGATGVRQVLDVHRQLRRACGDYQLAGDLTWGLSANLGGDDRTGVVTIQRVAA